PLSRSDKFLVGLRITILKQITRPLPTEDVKRRRSPGRALILAIAHKEFQKQRRHIELPCRLAIRKNGTEQAPHPRAAHESILIGRLVVAVAGREHDPLDAHVHNFIKESAHAIGVGSIKEGGIGGDAEAALDGLFDALDSDVVSTLAAHREIMVLTISVQVY